MPGKLTLFPPQRASRFVLLRDGESLEIGRDLRCGLMLEDSRVSRHHARLRWTQGGWVLEDLGSKNGTTVNGQPSSGAALRDGDWISFGGLKGCFEHLTAAQATTLDSQRLARIQTTAQMRRRLREEMEPVDVLLRFLELAMEVTQTERGFVLVARPQGAFRVEVAAGFALDDLRDERFRGSVGAVRQALETGEPVVVSHARADPRLGTRPSVVAQGIGCLACLPLRQRKTILGVIYVESRKIGPAFSELDVQSLEALADRAAAVLAEALRKRPAWPPPDTRDGLAAKLQQRIQQLLPAV